MAEKSPFASSDLPSTSPPGVRQPARQGVMRLFAPVERFLAIEASSGILLMIAAAVALVWANSPWHGFYESLWHIPIGLRIGGFQFERDLHFWINDGLMTIFFFVVGLEIRREIHAGELSEVRRAALPLAAAAGGMIVPAIIFALLNANRPSSAGWAIPMATDIAFAVGVLALLGRRVAPALRIFLLALAIIDDVGAILVIALFYSSELAPLGFAFVVLGILFTYSLRIIGVRSPLVYVAPGMIVWAGAYIGGIHPTLAGVVIGFMTPVKAWYGTGDFLNETEARLRVLRANDATNERSLISHLKTLGVASREAVSPVERLQHMLHGWVAYGVMPLFAFANAGVRMGQISFAGDSLWVFLGVALGLLIGKPIGILAVSWMAVRSGAAVLPRGVQWPAVAVIGMVGGIGFTMALFLAQLAFPTGPFLEVSKLAILCGSGLAGIFSLLVGYRILKLQSEPVIELSRAERSTLE